MTIFAFSSNMDGAQMTQRCPAAKLPGIGLLRDLQFQITTTTAFASNLKPGFYRPRFIEPILEAAYTKDFPRRHFDTLSKFSRSGLSAVARKATKADKRLIPIFVYGTLKQGFANNHLLSSSNFIGTAVTNQKFALYRAGIPYVCRLPQICRIHGEVYLVSAKTLQRIDDLEGHPHWYCREIIVVILSTGLGLPAWLYFYPRPRGELLPSGEYPLNHLR